LQLTGAMPEEALRGTLFALRDPSHELGFEAALAAWPDEWERVAQSHIDFGYTPDVVWVRQEMKNETEATERWVIYYQENFKQIFDAWFVRPDGTREHLISQSLDKPFTDRPLDFPQLAAPFALEPGASGVLVTRFWSEGTSLLPITIETEDSFARLSAIKSARNFMFYGALGAFVLAALIGSVLFRSRAAAAYAGYAGAGLLYIMHADGTAFQYLYPAWPRFNSSASVVWGGSFVFFAAFYSRTFLGTRGAYPTLHAMLGVVMAASLGLGLSMFVLDKQFVKQAFVVLALFGLLCCLGAGIAVARRKFKEVRFFVIAWTGAVVSSLLMNLIQNFGVDISQEAMYNSMRVVFVADAGLMGLALLDRYNQLRNARQSALMDSLSTAQRNLTLTRRLNDLERQMDLLEDASRRKDRAFADAIHDLRQPLQALRLSVRGSRESAVPDQTERSFLYLEQLISDYLEQLRSRDDTVTALLTAETETEQGLPLDEVLASVHEMFLPDAQDKGLRFVRVSTRHEVQTPPLEVMRIVSNLVANAIKYTDSGGVLLGCRRQGDMLRIEVHDTGPGMTAEEFLLAVQREVRLAGPGSARPGEGYGLSIASDLAVAAGGRLSRLSGGGRGCAIAAVLPLARQAAGARAEEAALG